ncbi:MAG: hypothetical protein H6682_22640 [Candidatus Eisenbacteria bacterium]|nr:hypothetical protein [Candidatus Eisenbacteria bacterium]
MGPTRILGERPLFPTGFDFRGPLGPDGKPFADAQTLRDLDLFPSGEDDPSLFALLDRTRTAGGKRALAEFLGSGSIDRKTIERRQAAIRYFANRTTRDAWALRSSHRVVSHLERYLESYVHPLTGPRGPIYTIRALWFRANYARYFEYLDSWIRSLHRLLLSLEESRQQRKQAERDPSQAVEAPPAILECLDSIDQLLDDDTVRAFLRKGGRYSRFGPAAMLHFDERFRRELAPKVRNAMTAIHTLDVYLALGTAAEELGLRFPRLDTDTTGPSRLDCLGLFHPFLEEPVRNEVHLGSEHGFLFLTGPNMAGKTTLMKALGLAVYMAHLGLPVPCSEMTFSLFDGLVSSLNVEDNLGKGYSFFYAEVRRVKDVAEGLAARRRLVVLFDELFKGTNLKDALDGSRLVVSGFRRFPGSLFVLSSHLLELGEELGQFATTGDAPIVPIQFQRFDATVENGSPQFSYRLRDGISSERMGMLILSNAGIPGLLGVSTQGDQSVLEDQTRDRTPDRPIR